MVNADLGSRIEFDVPVEIIAPAGVEEIGREAFAMVLQLPAGRADRLALDVHVRLARGAPALLEVARCACGGDILPARPPALRARHDCGSAAGFVIANIALALERGDVGPKVREYLAGLDR